MRLRTIATEVRNGADAITAALDPSGFLDSINLGLRAPFATVLGPRHMRSSFPTNERVAKLELAPGSTRAFKKKVRKAIKYLNKAGAAGKIAELEREKDVYLLEEGQTDEFRDSTKTITWDPTSGLEVEDGTQSPALGLVHEAGHALDHARGTAAGPAGSLADELNVIRTYETPAANRLGEPTRNGYTGNPVPVGCPTCTR